MLQECPFCDYSSRIDAVIDAHASAHTDDIGEPIMLINGVQHVLKRVKGATATFQCPSCEAEGLKGQVWDHYMEMHGSKTVPSSSGSQGRQVDWPDLPPAKKRKVDSAGASALRSPSPTTSSSGVAVAALLTPPTSSPADSVDNSTGDVTVTSAITPAVSLATIPAAILPVIIDTDRVFEDHPTTTLIFQYLHEQMSAVVRTCPYEQVMLGTVARDHQRLWRCSTVLLSNKKYEFKKVFTLGLKAEDGSCCFRCWTPQHPEFYHEDEPCDGFSRAEWEGWWRALPYLVWRTAFLREKLFPELGIALDAFANARAYAAWLTQPAHQVLDLNFNRKVTHLVAVVYLYFKLLTRNEVTPPGKGLALDPAVLNA
ncbi:hypothetical protein EV359DRAFT_86725 [Lentinula novae-zelandiae]|nr:hypothetical protein EV359DRAFT_86725 [Lentinula novae-zelandiae]